MKKNKLIAFALSLFLTAGLVPSIAANAAVKDTRTTIESSQEVKDSEKSTTIETEGTIVAIPTRPNSEIKTSGVKSKAVLKVAKALLKGTNKFIGTLRNWGWIDAETAGEMGCYSEEIGYWLEEVAAAGDTTAAYISENLPSKLVSWGCDADIAGAIGEAIANAVKVASWFAF